MCNFNSMCYFNCNFNHFCLCVCTIVRFLYCRFFFSNFFTILCNSTYLGLYNVDFVFVKFNKLLLFLKNCTYVITGTCRSEYVFELNRNILAWASRDVESSRIYWKRVWLAAARIHVLVNMHECIYCVPLAATISMVTDHTFSALITP